jgi:putative glutamine amidotransferase
MRKPIIGVSTDRVTIDGHPFLATGEKYLLPLAAHGMRPRLLPSLGMESVEELLDGLDGLLLTGAVSNIEPHHYGGGAELLCPPVDPARDATTLPLIRGCLARSIPLLAVCRGLQEMNVALGGTLHPRIHEQAGRFDHRAATGQSHDLQYGPAHEVILTPGGVLAGLVGGPTSIIVNSLHWQGIDRLAPGLVVEARAVDGTIEAVRPEFAKNFALAVQWHPEWRFAENRISQALFSAFGKAVMAVTSLEQR